MICADVLLREGKQEEEDLEEALIKAQR